MEMLIEKKTRLLCEDDVIKAIDKHTNEDGTLDNDISCILEEVHSVNIIGSKEAMENIKAIKSTKVDYEVVERRNNLAIEELYNVVENLDSIGINVTKRWLLYIIAVLEGVFNRK
jgi:hypothetical protein